MSAADKALTLAVSLKRWGMELSTLESLPSLLKAQKNRARDLRSAVDSYELCLEDGGPIPSHAWIARANATIN
jgi:hypothetical protein